MTPDRFSHHHWLIFDQNNRVIGCVCGFEAAEWDCGYGDSVVDHFAAIAWDEGYSQGVRDNENDQEPADNPYRETA